MCYIELCAASLSGDREKVCHRLGCCGGHTCEPPGAGGASSPALCLPEAQAPPKGTVEGDGPELRHGVRPVIPAGCWPRPSTWEEPGSWPRQLQVVQPEGAGMSPPRGWAENPGIATVPLPGHLRGLQVQEFSTKANIPPEPRCLFSWS